MILGSLIKILITLTGLLLTFRYLLTGLITRDRRKLKKSGIAFVSTFGVLMLFTMVEFALLTDDMPRKETVLVAVREASLGGIKLSLYKDKTYDLGTLRNPKWTGTYWIKNDTLFISSADSLVTSFVIDKNRLLEVDNTRTRINFLEIQQSTLE